MWEEGQEAFALGGAEALPPGLGAVIAQALGHHDKSATRIATDVGALWGNYAPGDHGR
ncbi:hypothetical protein [Streptomyces sp. NPDC053728]|uniref:hypothetical protein n=1 Tax=Streptomyces sp. NPDC053728 TaxID=3155534 RepID=UPI003419BD8F